MKSSATFAIGNVSDNTIDPTAGSRQRQTDLPEGLPAPLPIGERLVWQGRPSFGRFAFQIFHMRLIAAYFVVLAVWGAVLSLQDGGGIRDATLMAIITLACGAIALALLGLLAWLSARATVYSVTTGRIVMQIGIALNKTIDIPFKAIKSVDLKVDADGFGNISICPDEKVKLPYLMLWPHVRPWHLGHPQPMLRAVPDANGLAKSLVECLEAAEPAAKRVAQSTQTEGQTDLAPPPPVESHMRVPLFGAAAMVVLSLLTVGMVQLNVFSNNSADARAPDAIHQVSFKALETGQLAIIDSAADEVIGIVEPGRDGLVRNALRGLERNRTLRNLPMEAPYQLVFWDDGRVTLSDEHTSRHIPLSSFGATQSKALDVLLALNDKPNR